MPGKRQSAEGGEFLLNGRKQVYLAACSHSPPSVLLQRTLESYKGDLIEYGNPWDLWMVKVGESVSLFSKLIHSDKNEVFPSFSVSSALSSVMSSFRYGRRNRLIVSDLEYPTTNFIFLAQRRLGARTTTLRSTDFTIDPDAYSRAVDNRTFLTSAIHVSSMNGFRQNVSEISEIAHSAGSLFYTDAYQSLGTIPVDVGRWNVDLLSSGNLKYLLGLPGIAFMYVREELIPGLEPTGIGWFSQKDPFLFGASRLEYADGADRFQSGTLSIPSVYAAIEGMKTILGLGVRGIERHIAALTKRALEIASEIDLKSITPAEPARRGAIVSFVVRRPHELENRLREEGIITSSRGIGLRIAPHFYNTVEEVETAVERIGALRDF